VAWELEGLTGAFDVLATVLDEQDAPLASAVPVTSEDAQDQRLPAVALTPGGQVTVLWQDGYQQDPEAGLGTEVNARVLTPAGVPVSDVVRLNQSAQGTQRLPRLSRNPSGDCWALWEDESSGAVSLHGRLLPGCGLQAGAEAVFAPQGQVRASTPALDALGGVTSVYVADDLDEGDGAVKGVLLTEAWPATSLGVGTSTNGSITGDNAEAAWHYYYLDLPNQVEELTVTLTGLDGDADLLLQRRVPPTPDNAVCQSASAGTQEESCTVALPRAGRWWIGVSGAAPEQVSYTVTAQVEMIEPRYPTSRLR